jgi:hypothetical protein
MRRTDVEALVLYRGAYKAPVAAGQRVRELDGWQVNRFTAGSFAAQDVIVSPALRILEPEHHRRGGEWVKVSDRNESKNQWDEKSNGERGVPHKRTPICCGVAIVYFRVFSHPIQLGHLQVVSTDPTRADSAQYDTLTGRRGRFKPRRLIHRFSAWVGPFCPSPRPQKRRGRHSAPGKKTGDPCTDSSQPVFRNIAPQLKKLANHAPNHMANATGRFQLVAPLSKAWKKVVASRTSTG